MAGTREVLQLIRSFLLWACTSDSCKIRTSLGGKPRRALTSVVFFLSSVWEYTLQPLQSLSSFLSSQKVSATEGFLQEDDFSQSMKCQRLSASFWCYVERICATKSPISDKSWAKNIYGLASLGFQLRSFKTAEMYRENWITNSNRSDIRKKIYINNSNCRNSFFSQNNCCWNGRKPHSLILKKKFRNF